MAEFDQYKNDYQRIVERSIRFGGKPHDFYTKLKAEYFISILRERHPHEKNLSLLDVGCGHGVIHPYIKNSVGKLTGIDMAGEVIAMARKKNSGVSYSTFDGEHIPSPDHGYDAALMICVLHHVPPRKWADLLCETRRVLSPGGSLTVFEHNPLNPLTQLVVRTNVIDKDAVLLRRGHLVRLMAEAGFTDLESRYILVTPFENAYARKLETALGSIPLGAQYYVTGRARSE
jgi:ubiquinone/menaquinone biosynthesis C-methylase UbiE